MKRSFFIISICLVISSCSSSSEDDLTDPTPTADKVTYVGNVKSIMDNNCISCHSDPPVNSAPIALVTYAQVKDAIQNHNLIGRIDGSSAPLMPQGGPKLPQNLIDLVIQWKADGYLEQ